MISLLGTYLVLMGQVFKKPDKGKEFWRQLILEFNKLGVESVGIVAIISLFMGAVVSIQTAYNIDSPLIPLKMVGFTVRQSFILEFAPTVISLILAGKVGSRVASEIGTMRVTEQIDALQIMGVNAPNFLILPKIVAAVIYNPILITLSITLGLFGGWVAAVTLGLVGSADFIEGLQSWWDPYIVTYALIKTAVFAFIIVSVSAFHGYIIKGGALEVGDASTKAVVRTSILIILFNLLLTHLLL